MNRYVEESNYWNDPRVKAQWGGDSKYYKLKGNLVTFNEDWTEYLIEDGLDTVLDIEGGVASLLVSVSYQVCSLCEGHGSHVNPNIDYNGLTEDDIHDYEFMEDYHSGRYDVTCSQCNGMRVEPLIEFPEELEIWLNDRYTEDSYNYAEMAAERRFGCQVL